MPAQVCLSPHRRDARGRLRHRLRRSTAHNPTYRDTARLLRPLSGLSEADFEVRFALVLDMIFTALAGQQAQERTGDDGAVSRRPPLVENLIDCAVGSMAAARDVGASG